MEVEIVISLQFFRVTSKYKKNNKNSWPLVFIVDFPFNVTLFGMKGYALFSFVSFLSSKNNDDDNHNNKIYLVLMACWALRLK